MSVEQELPQLPRFSLLIPAILWKGNQAPQGKEDLPATRYRVNNIDIDAERLRAFNELLDWPDATLVHPCFLHTLAFPLQIKLMLQKAFPFSVMGVVHIANSFEQYQPVDRHSRVDICCYLGAIKRLKIGWLFSLHSEFYVAGKLVLKAKHQYLRRASQGKIATAPATPDVLDLTRYQSQQWQLPVSLGWQYANCSDDYNPIHLHPLSARLLGFKQNIAHGMWTKGRAFSALVAQIPALLHSPLRCEVEFKKPLYLPNTVTFYHRDSDVLASNGEGLSFGVLGEHQQQSTLHMSGSLSLLVPEQRSN